MMYFYFLSLIFAEGEPDHMSNMLVSSIETMRVYDPSLDALEPSEGCILLQGSFGMIMLMGLLSSGCPTRTPYMQQRHSNDFHASAFQSEQQNIIVPIVQVCNPTHKPASLPIFCLIPLLAQLAILERIISSDDHCNGLVRLMKYLHTTHSLTRCSRCTCCPEHTIT